MTEMMKCTWCSTVIMICHCFMTGTIFRSFSSVLVFVMWPRKRNAWFLLLFSASNGINKVLENSTLNQICNGR